MCDTIGTATYSPEDNKLRFYPDARLDSDVYARVKAAGFRWAPKQELFVAPKWTPGREDFLLELCGDIGDEDYSALDRSADRAERFGSYRDKRRAEAGDHADNFDGGPAAHGYQSQARAERAARRHDRQRTSAISQWSKAEYWQERTAGVISHALYKAKPGVRRKRILRIESELRGEVASYTPAHDPPLVSIHRGWDDEEPSPHVWVGPKGRGGQWVKVASLEARKSRSTRWVAHYELRLAYERSMLEAEGGSAAEVEMEPGGFFGNHQICKVNKSPATGRVVSVGIWGPHPWRTDGQGKPIMGPRTVNIERFGADAYRAPTDDEREAYRTTQSARRAASKQGKGAPKLLNPTDEDAQRLQAIWNARGAALHTKHRRHCPDPYNPTECRRMTQAQYSAISKGSYSVCETVAVCVDGYRPRNSKPAEIAFRIRKRFAGGSWTGQADAVVIITDKPQKPLPLDWEAVENPAQERATA